LEKVAFNLAYRLFIRLLRNTYSIWASSRSLCFSSDIEEAQ